MLSRRAPSGCSISSSRCPGDPSLPGTLWVQGDTIAGVCYQRCAVISNLQSISVVRYAAPPPAAARSRLPHRRRSVLELAGHSRSRRRRPRAHRPTPPAPPKGSTASGSGSSNGTGKHRQLIGQLYRPDFDHGPACGATQDDIVGREQHRALKRQVAPLRAKDRSRAGGSTSARYRVVCAGIPVRPRARVAYSLAKESQSR